MVTTAGAIQLPEPEVGFGFFYSPGRCKYANEVKYFEHMKAHGMNTFAPQANALPGTKGGTAAENIARQVNNACRVGMLNVSIPVICYSVDAQDVVQAYRYREPGLCWPELVVASVDEPNATQETVLKTYSDCAHAFGIRIGTAVAGYVCTGYREELPWCAPENVGHKVPGIGKWLDIWVVLVGTLTQGTRAACGRRDAMLGGYLAYPSNAQLDRFTFGLWAWKARTKTNLIWAYVDPTPEWDYSRIVETPEGPVDKPGMDGLAAGIMDYRVLQGVRDLRTKESWAWLKKVEKQTPLGWWPNSYVAGWELQSTQVPTVDMDAVRQEGIRLLQEARYGE